MNRIEEGRKWRIGEGGEQERNTKGREENEEDDRGWGGRRNPVNRLVYRIMSTFNSRVKISTLLG